MSSGVSVVNARTGHVLANFCRVAIGPEETRIGLLRSPKLQPGEGLLLAPCHAIHTVGMPFNIDVVFLDETDIVLGAVSDVGPGKQVMSPGAVSCLELPPGTIERSGTRFGDPLEVSYY
jgi:hypothetical protein